MAFEKTFQISVKHVGWQEGLALIRVLSEELNVVNVFIRRSS